ncbi:MAG: NAD(P)/FAD-dependent oxidoreductase [Eubacteriales bacterium]|nr:NAD(P)/FAD-dependent oxidoreductase [Eubacteriales bacterium]
MRDIVIIGKGPAGISAALYIKRAGLSVTVVGKDHGALAKAEKIQNYFGYSIASTGVDLVESGWKQAQALGVELVTDEVVDLSWNGGFTVKTATEEYDAQAVIIATGSARKAPRIAGLAQLEGRGVSYCAVCDAFFYRGKRVAVLGNARYALHEAKELLPVVGSVTLLTNGLPASDPFPAEIRVLDKPVTAILGDEQVRGVSFSDGTTEEFDGLFVALGSAAAGDLARKLGAAMNGTHVDVDADMATNIPGLYAAGDCIGGMQQVSSAVAEGAKAATSAIAYVRQARVSAAKK